MEACEKKEKLAKGVSAICTQNKKMVVSQVALSAVGLLFSLNTMVVWPLFTDTTFLQFAPQMDYMVDSWCCFLILGRNRRYMRELWEGIRLKCYKGCGCLFCWCCCEKSMERMNTMLLSMQDVDSRRRGEY